MTFGNDRKELRKGEKFMVTVEEVLHNTLLVFLEYRKAKFCGVLLNTTNRRGPYGVEEKPDDAYYRSYGIDPAKINAGDEVEIEKAKEVAPSKFPQTLDTRTTYGQNIKQPPPRQIYMRRRRSKRRIRMDMMDTDLALKLVMTNSGRKLLSHPSACCCDKCAAGGLKKLSDEKPSKGKRKLITDGKKEKEIKRPGWVDGVKALSDESKRIKLHEKTVEKSNPKDVKTATDIQPLKRSPVIKISYKSPGGKGRMLKIPSRLHSPTSSSNQVDNNAIRSAMHERARKVVIRAKTEHFKYLKEHLRAATSTYTPKKWEVSFSDYLAHKNVNSAGTSAPPGVEESQNISPSKRKTKMPRKLGTVVEAAVILPSQSSTERVSSSMQSSGRKTSSNYEKSTEEVKNDVKPVENGNKESPNLEKRRQLRNCTPHVLLQPLEKDKSDDTVDVPVDGEKAVTPSQSVAKSLKVSLTKGTVAADVLNAMLANSGGPKKKENSAVSHSITVTRCVTKEGVQWCQGDVVWAKIMGFPWWPGILRKIIVKKEENSLEQVAIVDWFQSKTVSHIPCNALESFSGNFKKRYKKRIAGNYKKAIHEAREAEKKMSPEVRKLIMQFET